LSNPPKDAGAVAAALRRLGFDVTEKYDLGNHDLVDQLKAFGDRAANADWAVVYFAGHGIEVNGENYLIPVDARLDYATHVEDEAVPLSRVVAKAGQAKKVGLIILDACRSNPFLPGMKVANAGRSIGRGLARVVTPRNVYVAFSARPGQIAKDGKGEHSPYAKALLEYMEKPGVDIDFMFRQVRDRVMQLTGEEADPQQPYTENSLPAEHFCFNINNCGG